MKYIVWVLRILLFVILFAFAFKNTDPVSVKFYFGGDWQAPLAIVLLIAFVLGAAAGFAAGLGMVWRKRREVVRLRKQLRTRGEEETL